MTKIETIKQRILTLDGGQFQNLCSTYLYKSGYPNICSLGGKPGTSKTTIGTPDTYFNTHDGKYIFVEYTTQEPDIFAKIKTDIIKCLDVSKTKISHDQIAEIIYCHTTSNIKPAQDNELRSLSENAGIKLTIIGIDKLSEDLYLYHHNLVLDYLGIQLSTGQIQYADDFIKNYNANRMAAPIDTEFLFRDQEFKSIEDAFNISDIVILTGAAGTGKTRLALQYAQKHSHLANAKIFCISNNALPIYDDLKIFIDKPGNYFLFVDDANQLSGLQHIIRYTTMKPEGYHVKIIITVRDYALQKVINDIREISSYQRLVIESFSDDEIRILLETALNIKNQHYQDRIIRIAEGNARLAMLAGKIAVTENRLDSIHDASQLYDDYYGQFLEKEQVIMNDDMLATAGIIAFLEAIHLHHIDTFLPILNNKGLSRDSFIENIYKLNQLEIVDLYHDKAVRFSEQCLSNYILKYVFYDRKLISLSDMVHLCFIPHKERVISSINTLLNIFINKQLFQFVEDEIKLVWDKLLLENSSYYFDFVKVFFRINPTKTLLILQREIEQEAAISIAPSDMNMKDDKNNQVLTNDIITILGGFADRPDLPTALDLFCQYYIKRPDLFMEFYHAANGYFSITKNSAKFNFNTQIAFIEKIKEYAVNPSIDHFIFFFLAIAKDFLKLHFTPSEGNERKLSITIYQIPLTESEGSKAYRKLIWEWLLELCQNHKYKNRIKEILFSYPENIEDASRTMASFDLPYIQSIMENYFLANELQNCLLANHLVKFFSRNNISSGEIFANYLSENNFCIYSMLKGSIYDREIAYSERKAIKRTNIEQHIIKCDLAMFKQIIDVCSEIKDIDWEVERGLYLAFDAACNQTDYYVEVIKYYIEKGTMGDLDPCRLITPLFDLIKDNEILQIITAHEYAAKNEWLYAYYHELPIHCITDKHLQNFYSFLADNSDKDIKTSRSRDLDFLDKYNQVDKDVFIKACEIILTKAEYSPFMVNIYFSLMFNEYHNTPQELVQRFYHKPNLLEEMYLQQLLYGRNDHDGKFLKEIYTISPTILDKYIDILVDKKGMSRNYHEMHKCFFDLSNYIEVYNYIFDQLVKRYKSPKYTVPSILKTIILPVQNEQSLLEKQDAWICQCIQNFADDEIKMDILFSVLSKLEIERKTDYISLFIKHNPSFEAFRKIPLAPSCSSWSGSAIPMHYARMEFFQQLLPIFPGLEWIKHKDYIEERIKNLRKQIEQIEIQELLKG